MVSLLKACLRKSSRIQQNCPLVNRSLTIAKMSRAEEMSKMEVEEVSKAIANTNNLKEVVDALLAAKPKVFPEEELASIRDAAAKLCTPLAERPKWTSEKSRGRFFVFEGLDRSGKSTQSRRLHKSLEQQGQAKWMCFPNRSTPSGVLIDLYLRNRIELTDQAIHELFSANRWEMAESIVDDLNQGCSIVCDRYAFSGVAYSTAKGLDLQGCKEPDRGVPVPDGVFFLHVDEKVGASRANFGDERYENATMQSQVRKVFQESALREGVFWNDVDGARDIETISSEIAGIVQDLMQSCQENGAGPIQHLWI